MIINDSTYKDFLNRFPAATLAIAERRRLALEQLKKTGLPTRKTELWKYTNLKSISEAAWTLPVPGELHHDQMKSISQNLAKEMTNLVFVDGVLNRTLSDTESLNTGLSIATDDEWLQGFAGIDQTIAAFFDATASSAVKLAVQKDTVIEKPVHVLFVSTSSGSVSALHSNQFQIVVGSRSSLKLIVNHMSINESATECRLMQVQTKVEASSKLEIFSLQNLNLNSTFIQQSIIDLEKDSLLSLAEISFGSKISRLNTEVRFLSENAEAQINSCNIIGGTQHADQFASIEHRKGHNKSEQHAKSILSGSAQAVFRGRVYIAKDAQKASSEQLNNNLLLSQTAKAQSIPQLEIYADDVKAGHGATVGQLSSDELFYFLSRGISSAQAKQMLAEGFAKEIVYKTEDIHIQNFVQSQLQSKLQALVSEFSQTSGRI